MRGLARRPGGWSLVELAVVLAVIGVLGLVLWRVLPLAPRVAADNAAERELERAEQALLGFALAHGRLPAPVSVHGRDMLPVRALGLPSTMDLRYQVQPMLTSPPGNLFAPVLPPQVPGGGSAVSAELNGLDFCMALKNSGPASLAGMQGIPTAFALMHPGPVGHDNNASAAFVLPGSATAGTRNVLAVGPGELASRLACPDRISRVHGAARAAHAAYDLERVAERYRAFREFAVQVAEMNKDNSEAGVAFAAFDVAWGVFCEAVAILQEAAGWPPDPVGIATGIASHVSATAQLGIAIANVALAAADLDKANGELATAREQQGKAEDNLARMQAMADQTLARVRTLDKNGLKP